MSAPNLLIWRHVYGDRGVHHAECAIGTFRTRTAGRRVILTLNDVVIGNHGEIARARAGGPADRGGCRANGAPTAWNGLSRSGRWQSEGKFRACRSGRSFGGWNCRARQPFYFTGNEPKLGNEPKMMRITRSSTGSSAPSAKPGSNASSATTTPPSRLRLTTLASCNGTGTPGDRPQTRTADTTILFGRRFFRTPPPSFGVWRGKGG